MDKSKPKIILEKCSDFKIPIDIKVWKLDVSTSQIHISKLEFLFDMPLWKYQKKWFAISPNQVIENKTKYKNHWNRIKKADLKYPIDIMKNDKGHWEILDGLHRLAKAKILSQKYIVVRKVPLSKIKQLLPKK